MYTVTKDVKWRAAAIKAGDAVISKYLKKGAWVLFGGELDDTVVADEPGKYKLMCATSVFVSGADFFGKMASLPGRIHAGNLSYGFLSVNLCSTCLASLVNGMLVM